jgi:hypothetical protein
MNLACAFLWYYLSMYNYCLDMCSSMYMFLWYIFIIHGWYMEKGKEFPCCALINIQNSMNNLRGSYLFWWIINVLFLKWNLISVVISHQKGEIKSASRPLIDFSDWKNTNKNLIVLMSIKQEFRQPKRRKGKETPNSCQFKWRIFEGVQAVFQSVFMFLEYRNTVL